MAPKTTMGFTNNKGIYYDKVREVAYRSGQLVGNLGTFVAETIHEHNLFFESSHNAESGVYIYQSYSNPVIAYRIYKTFADCGFNGYKDDELIQKLMERQNKIKLSQFPTGVVTLEGKIIGQEIPYFCGEMTLCDFFKKYEGFSPVKIYRAILDVLYEMYDNGIIYLDNHPKNFMINPSCIDKGVDVIDFDEAYVKFDDDSEMLRQRLFNNYGRTINALNEMCGALHSVGQFEPALDFNDAYKQLGAMEKKLVR